MKNIIFIIVFIITMALTANAQSDVFFKLNSSEEDIYRNLDENVNLPTTHGNGIDHDAVPLGSGLLILSALGAGYALKKKLEW